MCSKLKQNESASIFICGDILSKKKCDIICSSEMSGIIKSSDYAVCNFEAPIRGFGEKVPKAGIHHSQDSDMVQKLKEIGFDSFLLANNHMLDYGELGLTATLDLIRKCNLDFIGAGVNGEEAYRPLVRNFNGIKIGMLNACEAQYGEINSVEKESKAGYAWINHPKIDLNIIKLKKECDFVIVFAHAGLEHYPIPIKEWRVRYKHLCDLGADVIVGSHPHVPQGFEKYKDSYIFYSLGNFFFNTKKKYIKKDVSYAIKLFLNKDNSIDFDIIHHYVKNEKVHIAPSDIAIDIDILNNMLELNYEKEHHKMILEVYDNIKRGLTISTFLPVHLDSCFRCFIRSLLAYLFKRNKTKTKQLFQYYLLNNETYYYVIKNALEINLNGKMKN
jgi:poly-gamma-glutamate synthesis protein (capsule biosynthesis protein)